MIACFRRAAIAAAGLWFAFAWTTTAAAQPPLQQRVDALAELIDLRYAGRPERHAAWREATQRVLDAWNRSPDRPASDRRRLDAWLTRAFDAALPGRGETALPSAPRFSEVALVQPPRTTAPTVATPPPAPTPFDRQTVLPRRFVRDPAPEALPTEPGVRAAAKPVVAGSTQADRGAEANEASPSADRPRRSRWSRHPAAAPLEWRDPFTDDPSASRNPLRGSPRTALRPTFEAAQDLARVPAADGGVAVNLTELGARVRAYNTRLRGLQRQIGGGAPPDAFLLSDLADELTRLDAERRFLDLYRDGLGTVESRRLPPSPSIDLASELLRRQAETRLRQVAGRGDAEARALTGVTDRLSRLAEPSRGF